MRASSAYLTSLSKLSPPPVRPRRSCLAALLSPSFQGVSSYLSPAKQKQLVPFGVGSRLLARVPWRRSLSRLEPTSSNQVGRRAAEPSRAEPDRSQAQAAQYATRSGSSFKRVFSREKQRVLVVSVSDETLVVLSIALEDAHPLDRGRHFCFQP